MNNCYFLFAYSRQHNYNVHIDEMSGGTARDLTQPQKQPSKQAAKAAKATKDNLYNGEICKKQWI